MALKGTTLIELTNVKTGEVERYEEHNLVTKALEYLHQPIGALKSPTALTTGSTSYEPAYAPLLGGLVLWDNTIEEQDTTVTQPHGVKAIGCAAYGQVNTTASPRRGSYNEAESVLATGSSGRSMKFVYDFTTSQANGTIKCVSLTNWESGWNGFGGNEKNVDNQGARYGYNDAFGLSSSTSFMFSSDGSYTAKLFLIDADADVFYEIQALTTSSLTIAKRRANINQKSVFTNQYTAHDLVESIRVNLPVTLSGASSYACNYEPKSNLLYVVVNPTSSHIAASGKFYAITVDMATFEATVYTLTNTLGTTLYFDRSFIVCSDRCVHYAYDGQYYIRSISLADSTYSSTRIGGRLIYGDRVFLANEMIYFHVRRDGSSVLGGVAMFDPVTKVYEFLGDTGRPQDLYSGSCSPVPILGHPLHYYYFYVNTGYLLLNTKYLATINNLSRPVEKTSDKTMKITYTIQEV
jgi:hypothetical protein